MKYFFHCTWLSLLELVRQPTYVVTTLIFPSLFFAFFGIPNAKDAASSAYLMGSFSAFGVLGVLLFQLCVAVAHERSSAWSQYQRTWPVPAKTFFMARVFCSLVLATLTVVGVMVLAVFFTDLEMSHFELLRFLAIVLLAGVPFAALGIFLGQVVSARAATPVANLVYLPLSFAGGLWMPPGTLSDSVQKISEILPSRAFGEIVWAVANSNPIPAKYLQLHIFYSFVFIGLAIVSYRWSEARRWN
jgi:ABC-2 type transport system permease protein